MDAKTLIANFKAMEELKAEFKKEGIIQSWNRIGKLLKEEEAKDGEAGKEEYKEGYLAGIRAASVVVNKV